MSVGLDASFLDSHTQTLVEYKIGNHPPVPSQE